MCYIIIYRLIANIEQARFMTTSMQNPTLTRLCRPCDSFRTHRKNVKPETEISEGDEDVILFQNIYRIFDLSSESKLFFYIQIGVI